MPSPQEPKPTGEGRASEARASEAKAGEGQAGGAEASGPKKSRTRTPVGSLTPRLAVLVVAAAASALGAWLGAWWVPFLVGVAAGALGRPDVFGRLGPPRPSRPLRPLLPALIGAAVGWAIPLWVLALDRQPVGATSRAIAALAGLPPYAGVAIAVALLLAALQVLVGAWLARAVFPRRPAPVSADGPGDPRGAGA